jgi:hypothetical protein
MAQQALPEWATNLSANKNKLDKALNRQKTAHGKVFVASRLQDLMLEPVFYSLFLGLKTNENRASSKGTRSLEKAGSN